MRITTQQISLLTVVILLSGVSVGSVWGAKKGNAGAEHATKGVELVQQKQYDAAVAEFTAAIQADPKNARLYASRGAALRAAGMALAATDQANSQAKLQQALADCAKAIEVTPNDFFGYMERSQVELSLYQYDAALADANKTIELKADESTGYKFRGFAYIGLSQWDKAIADFTSAIEKKPDDMQNYDKRAQCYRQLKQYDPAIADYTTVLTQNPNDPETLIKRGFTYASKQDYEKAIADYEAALKIKGEANDYETVQRLQYARAMLAAQNAPSPTPTPAPTPEPRGLMTPLNIGIALGLILIVAIIIKLVSTRGKTETPTSSRIR
jgi:tetratricopeptide (TPR) repeat protein